MRTIRFVFHFNVSITPMNRYANLKPHAAQDIARAGSHSLWRELAPTLAVLAAPRGGAVRGSGRPFAANGIGMPAGIGGIDVLK